jgi:hypothetical protein
MAARWVILITDGTAIEFAPELYQSRDLAEREAQRWAWHVSAGGQIAIRERFAGRFEVGIRDVRLVEVDVPNDFPDVEPWIGTYWTRDGYPDPEAIVLAGREDAESWASTALPGRIEAHRVETTEWQVAATFVIRGEETYAVASLAKAVCKASKG